MSDLISRSALLEASECCDCPSCGDDDCDFCHIPIEAVENAPAVDAVDVDKALTWLEGYTMTDTEKIYSNGTVFVPLYRVKQAFVDKLYNGLWEADDGEQSAAESQTQES